MNQPENNPANRQDRNLDNASVFFSYLSGREKLAFILLQLKNLFFASYKSSFGKLIYSTRFNRWDWLGAVLIFGMTFFFSILAGQKAMMNGYIGNWYAHEAAPVAISIYNIGTPKWFVHDPGTPLDNFMTKGSFGGLAYYKITNEEAQPKFYGDPNGFIESTGLAYLMAWWWKKIDGHPDWSTLYILFSIMGGLTMVAAYFALRQVIGVIPAVFLTLLLSAYPMTMQHLTFWVRDGARAIFCFIAIAILLYQLKRGFNWKGTLACSLALFMICTLSTEFRNDFILFIPFILVAVLFFHGKLLRNIGKKVLLVASIVIGFAVASQLPRLNTHHAFNHVLYVGLADVPYMDYLHFSADNYSKGIPYADFYAFAVGASKAYRDRKEVNLRFYSEEYDKEINKELMNLAQLYPFDFLRFAFSSSIQSLRTGYRFADKPLLYIDSAPGYNLFPKKSRDFYSGLPSWLYFALLILTMLLFLGGRFYANILLCIAIMCMSGCYMMQFDVRHYFFLMIVPLLCFGFLLNRMVRIAYLLFNDRKRILTICRRKRKSYLIHCAVFIGLIGIAVGILQIAKQVQIKQVTREMESFQTAKTEEVKFEKETAPSKLQPNLSAVKVLLPDFCGSILAKENPEQKDFTEFLKVKFKVVGAGRKEMIRVFSTYETTDKYTVLPQYVSEIINPTQSYPVPMTFFARSESCTLYMPVYFSRGYSPLTGIELLADGKDIEIESVERVAETENIRTQSAFLIPEQTDKMRYFGKVNWESVLWER